MYWRVAVYIVSKLVYYVMKTNQYPRVKGVGSVVENGASIQVPASEGLSATSISADREAGTDSATT